MQCCVFPTASSLSTFPSRAFAAGVAPIFRPAVGTLSRAFCGDFRTGFDLSSISCQRNSWCIPTKRRCFCPRPTESIATSCDFCNICVFLRPTRCMGSWCACSCALAAKAHGFFPLGRRQLRSCARSDEQAALKELGQFLDFESSFNRFILRKYLHKRSHGMARTRENAVSPEIDIW